MYEGQIPHCRNNVRHLNERISSDWIAILCSASSALSCIQPDAAVPVEGEEESSIASEGTPGKVTR